MSGFNIGITEQMYQGYYPWSEINLEQCWLEIMELWQSDEIRKALLKDPTIDCLKGEDHEEATNGGRLPWHSYGSAWHSS